MWQTCSTIISLLVSPNSSHAITRIFKSIKTPLCPSHGSDYTSSLLLQGQIWHYIIRGGRYAIKKRDGNRSPIVSVNGNNVSFPLKGNPNKFTYAGPVSCKEKHNLQSENCACSYMELKVQCQKQKEL